MLKYKIVTDGYIMAIGYGSIGQQITDAEYNQILELIQNRPTDTETIGYMLKEDLTWEQYDKEPPVPYVEEPDAEELLNILTGETE